MASHCPIYKKNFGKTAVLLPHLHTQQSAKRFSTISKKRDMTLIISSVSNETVGGRYVTDVYPQNNVTFVMDVATCTSYILAKSHSHSDSTPPGCLITMLPSALSSIPSFIPITIGRSCT